MLSKFKVGDMVRVAKVVRGAPQETVGYVGAVQAVEVGSYGLRSQQDLPWGRSLWWYAADELEHVHEHAHVTEVPDPRDDALDRIAEVVRCGDLWAWSERLDEIANILRESGRDVDSAPRLRETGRL